MRVFGRMILTAAMVWLAATGSAVADVYDDNPATASRGPGEIYVFARASDGAILERHRHSGKWSDWASLGGNATSGPSAVVYSGALLVFVRGVDGGIYQNTMDAGGRWSGWAGIGGYSTSAPGANVRKGSSNVLDLVVKGGDNALWHRAYVPGTGWTAPASIAGNLTSAPTVNSQSADLLNIWARGTDGAVYQRSWTGAAWADWSSIGGGTIGAPSSVSRTDNVINVYARGAADALYARSWLPSGWGEWFLLDATPIASSPAAGGDGPAHEWVVARNGSGIMLKEWTSGAGWGAWDGLGSVAVPAPAPPPPPPPGPPATTPDGQASLTTGLRCTPAGGRLRVNVAVKKPKGANKPRVTRIVFYTKGKGRKVRSDRKAPFVVRIQINRPAGSVGRVYARVYYKRSAHGKVHRKTVSRRYTVCR
jgi:hypothetical protein